MSSQINIKNSLLLGSVILISSLIIFYRFPFIPQNLSYDEVEFAKLALSLKDKPYIPYSSLATGHSTLYFYVLLFFLQVFGINSFALRLPAALFGIFNVALFYFILQKVFTPSLRGAVNVRATKQSPQFVLINKIASLPLVARNDELINSLTVFLLTIIFLTSHWYFNFARFSFEATFLLFLELSAILFFFQYQQTKQLKYIVITGIITGFAYLSYTPGRIFFILPLVFLLFQKNLKALISFILPFALIILPLTYYLTQNPDIRVQQLSFMQNKSLSIQKKTEFFTQNVLKTTGMFHLQGDLNGRQNYPGKPALNPILGLLFLGGFLITLYEWKKSSNLFFLLYFFISLTPVLFTYPQENPHMLRTFTTIPSVVYMIGQTVFFIQKKLPHKYQKVYIAGLAILIMVSSIYELRTYFVYQMQVFPEAFEMKGELHELIKKKL